MEPTGMMDQSCRPSTQQQQQQEQKQQQHNKRGMATRCASAYQVCDMADEEVHFSRNPLESSEFYYYSYDKNFNQVHTNSTTATAHEQPPASLGDINLFSQSPNGHPPTSNLDQVKSSRLLNSISSRLRRGSNYLNASKVVGQYLLGITIQNWSEFFNTSRMLRAPCTRHQLTRRLLTNLSYFQGNYLCVSLVLVIYCILTLPLLLLAIAFYLLALYLVTVRSALGKQTRVFGYRLNLQQQYSFITMLSLPPLWCAGAPSAVFWVIGASFFVVGLHASMYANERALAAEVSPCQGGAAAHVLSLQAATGDQHEQQQQQQRRTSAVNYYNHYATAHDQTLTSSCAMMASYQAPEVTKQGANSKANSSGYMPIVLSQWIPFTGGSSRSSFACAADGPPAAGAQRVPEVKIISHDFAGLGRVYEV